MITLRYHALRVTLLYKLRLDYPQRERRMTMMDGNFDGLSNLKSKKCRQFTVIKKAKMVFAFFPDHVSIVFVLFRTKKALFSLIEICVCKSLNLLQNDCHINPGLQKLS